MSARAPIAVVFDLDGTLVHSAPHIHWAATGLLEALGRPALPLETVQRFVGNGVAVFVERCLAATGGEADRADREAALAVFRARYAEVPEGICAPYPGVPALLEALSARGLPLAICTNKPEAPARALCAALDFQRHFPVLVGGDTLETIKPDPAPLHEAFARLGAEPAAGLFVGDSETDAETARRAGVAFALFTGGYRKAPPADLLAGQTHAFAFDDHDALAAALT